jgi:hypothetical protein
LDPDPDPDPLVRGTDPGIWIRIRTKMSRILNTEGKAHGIQAAGIFPTGTFIIVKGSSDLKHVQNSKTTFLLLHPNSKFKMN